MNRLTCFFLGLKEYKKDIFSTTVWTAKHVWSIGEYLAYSDGQELGRWFTGTRMSSIPLNKEGRPDAFSERYMTIWVPSHMPMWEVHKVARDYFLEREANHAKNL